MPEFVMDAGLESQSRRVTGKVISIDHFGNVISSIPGSAIPRDAKRVQVQFAGLTLDRVDRCYADRPVGEFIALVGSSGRLEVAIVNGNAASQLGASANEPIYVTWKDPA
jgi:S-adenosylmethionine hydrolase